MKAIVSRHEDTWNKTPYLISGKKKKKIWEPALSNGKTNDTDEERCGL